MRILIVDDHPIFRQGLSHFLQSEANLEVCGEAHSAAHALEALRKIKADVVLVDIALPDANGELLPNTNITVKVLTNKRTHVLTMPREALHIEGADRFVYRVTNGKLVQVPIIPGVVNLTQVILDDLFGSADLVSNLFVAHPAGDAADDRQLLL